MYNIKAHNFIIKDYAYNYTINANTAPGITNTTNNAYIVSRDQNSDIESRNRSPVNGYRTALLGNPNEYINKSSNKSFIIAGVSDQKNKSKYRKNRTVPILEFIITPSMRILIKAQTKNIEYLIGSKKESDFVITGSREENIPMHRVSLTRTINIILSETGAANEKTLTSHSFRKGVTTNLINNEPPLEVVKSIMGRSDIKTTAAYSNRSLDSKQKELFLEKIWHNLHTF